MESERIKRQIDILKDFANAIHPYSGAALDEALETAVECMTIVDSQS